MRPSRHPVAHATFSSPPIAPSAATVGDAAYRPLRCQGRSAFASALAVDVARLLDVDPAVDRWRCRVLFDDGARVADFAADGPRGEELLLVAPNGSSPSGGSPMQLPCNARVIGPDDVDPVRLENAKAILPFARWRVSLDDRVRLLAALDEEGSVTLADCLAIFRNTSRPIAAVASLALARVVDLDLDEPIGSRMRVIRREA